MKKIKIATVMIATLFITSAVATMAGAGELKGEIDVEIFQWVGLVAPVINLDVNQTGLSPLKVDVIEGNETIPDKYYLNDTLSIKVNVTDSSGRKGFILPRLLFGSVFLVREKKNIPTTPLLSYFQRLIPIRMLPFGQNKVKIDVSSEGDKYINISMGYKITNTTLKENLTLHIVVMGMFPGNSNGIGETLPIVSYKKVNLIDVEYAIPE